jgi:hypothetical protein
LLQPQYSFSTNIPPAPIFLQSQFSFIPSIPSSPVFLHPQYSFIPNIPSSPVFLHPQYSFIPNIPSSPVFLQPQYSFSLNIPSAPRPVEHDDSLPVPKPPQQWTLHEEETASTSPEHKPGPSCSSDDLDFLERTGPYFIAQSVLNDIVGELNLSKIRSALLVSHLQGWNLLQQGGAVQM